MNSVPIFPYGTKKIFLRHEVISLYELMISEELTVITFLPIDPKQSIAAYPQLKIPAKSLARPRMGSHQSNRFVMLYVLMFPGDKRWISMQIQAIIRREISILAFLPLKIII